MRKIFTFFLIFFFMSATYAQEIEKQNHDRNGYPTFVKFNTKVKSFSKSETKAVLSGLLNMTKNDEFKSIRSEDDQIGFTHEKFQQYYQGIKVENGTYTIHSRKGVIESLSGEYKLIKDITISPSITIKEATEIAKAFVDAKEYLKADHKAFKTATPELVIVKNSYGKNPKNVHEMVLAYKIDVYATKPLSRAYIYVNAITGEIAFKNDIIKLFIDSNKKHSTASLSKGKNVPSTKSDANGTAATRYSGSRSIAADSYGGYYRLRESGRNIQTFDCNMGASYNNAVDFTDNDNNWTSGEHNNAQKDNAALDAHWGAEKTYDYFYNVHGRNSFDGYGAAIRSYVHFDLVEYGQPSQDNAFWNGSVLTYGDGTQMSPLTCIDVVAHEIGHAVMSHTANLTYSYESGAMNEAFSDIWGTAVEYYAAPNKDTWVCGEDIGGPIRSLSNPNAYQQPDTYKGTYWYTGSQDNGGVHYNSGVLNHWFYILSEGKSGTNDNGDSYSVTGIGIDKAAKIAYRMLSVYLSASSQHSHARTYAIQSAEDLYGTGSNEVIQTTNAMYAVGIGSEYTGGSSGYCTSKGNSVADEWIANVTVGSFNKSTGANGGYADFTSNVVTLNAGSNSNISLSPGFSGSAYNEYWKIWIDFNDDDDFNDAGEEVFDAGSVSNSNVTGSISIPTGVNGYHRMRVTMKYNGAPTPCETFSYGEVEDYTVNIVGGGGDTQAPSTPNGLSSSNITQTSITLSWNASNDNVGVTGYNVYLNGSNLGSVSGTTANITGLTANTTYSFYVKAKDAAGNVSNASNSLNVKTAYIKQLAYSTFEGGWGIWKDNGIDCKMYTGGTRAYGGQKAINIQDNSGIKSSFQLKNGIDVHTPGYKQIKVTFKFYPYSMENGEDFLVQYYTGSSWKIVASWKKGTHFVNNRFYTGTVLINESNYNFPTNMKIRFRCDASGDADDVYIDNIKIVGKTVPESLFNGFSIALGSCFTSTELYALVTEDVDEIIDEDAETIKLYPNPAKDEITLIVPSESVNAKIISITGSVVRDIYLTEKENKINISDIPKGIYLISVESKDGHIVKRFIKQ